ncbi:hypothetical protein HYC85_029655 [Camellia sinensis]|uniref:Uncharacterized protein n=1 Tax=Camellia sinensis TaxID=4442 RepID=A0A7J7G2G7_CAMSI|nr:hypothetical protein HYC85_029655 [Camellia sinensis]
MVFHFTKEEITKLKAKANAEMNTTTISSLQALLAHLWRKRQGFDLPLAEGYFGNIINGETLRAVAEKVVGKGLGWVTWQMNKAIALQMNDGIRKLYEDWVKNPKLLENECDDKQCLDD